VFIFQASFFVVLRHALDIQKKVEVRPYGCAPTFQMASYSNLDLIDFGVYITTTKAMQKFLTRKYGHNWDGSLFFKKVEKSLPYFKSAIQVPIYVIGIDI